ncbi:MAG: 2-dehydropantoate 2-reductase, partial [Gammaproteobacteria bacterium]|nr:2-dehydropantoate 2-reductase [Gammaproteobacteria bacterium]
MAPAQRICIVGAGAIGGFLGTRLAASGARVAALARGTSLVALRDHGWRLQQAGGPPLQAPVASASDDPRELGPQDVLILSLKAPALPHLAPHLESLLTPDTVILPAMNGVPWWFGTGVAALGREPLHSVDPDG